MSATPTDDLDDDGDGDTVALIDAVTELRERFGVALPYQTAWGLCVGGVFPAARVRGRWYLRRADLPQVAALAGSRRAGRPEPSERSPAAA
jgi:hypothetical protein